MVSEGLRESRAINRGRIIRACFGLNGSQLSDHPACRKSCENDAIRSDAHSVACARTTFTAWIPSATPYLPSSAIRAWLFSCAMRRGRAVYTQLRRRGLQLAARGGGDAKKRAVTAVARKLSVLLHHFWKTGEVYEPLRKTQITESTAA